jgi:hypothetical protein
MIMCYDQYLDEEDYCIDGEPCETIDPDALRDSLIDDAMFCESKQEAWELQDDYPWLARYLPEKWRR